MIYNLLLAMSGFVAGLVIAALTKEEVNSGISYFIIVKNLLWGALEIVLLLFLIQQKQLLSLTIIIIISIIALALELKFKTKFWLAIILVYVIIISSYWLLEQGNYQYLITVLAFLYGLPAGTVCYPDFSHFLKKITRQQNI